ncbi:MAG: hypothetical protein AAGJ50_14690, partial [Pseudomonadota bacterium]
MAITRRFSLWSHGATGGLACVARGGRNTKVLDMLKVNLVCIGAAFCYAAQGAAAATPSPPSMKPPVIYASSIVSTQDAAILREAIRAADERDWPKLRQLKALARDEAVADLILWQLARAGNPHVGFDTLNEAMTRLPEWPGANGIRNSAEEAISISTLLDAERMVWFEALGGPRSGEGKVAYADALRRAGDRATAVSLVRDAWQN